MLVLVIILIVVIVYQFFSRMEADRESCLRYGKNLRLKKDLDFAEGKLRDAKQRIKHLEQLLPEEDYYAK